MAVTGKVIVEKLFRRTVVSCGSIGELTDIKKLEDGFF